MLISKVLRTELSIGSCLALFAISLAIFVAYYNDHSNRYEPIYKAKSRVIKECEETYKIVCNGTKDSYTLEVHALCDKNKACFEGITESDIVRMSNMDVDHYILGFQVTIYSIIVMFIFIWVCLAVIIICSCISYKEHMKIERRKEGMPIPSIEKKEDDNQAVSCN